MSDDFKMVAKTFYGFESILADELLSLGARDIEEGVRNVSFYGDLGFLYKVNLALSTSVRVLKPITSFKIKDEKDLYSSIYNFNWEDYLDVDDTFAVESNLNTDFFSHSLFVSQRVKDALVDRYRKLFKKRPNVDRDDHG
jgi:putative N6-adenine-specific DNA methylase